MKNDTKTLGIGYDIKTGDVEITAPDDVHEIPLDIVKKYNMNFVQFEFAKSYGEIDTGGTDDYALNSWLENNNITLEEFLINPRYAVICDGDEYCTFDKLIDLGLINKSKFEMR